MLQVRAGSLVGLLVGMGSDLGMGVCRAAFRLISSDLGLDYQVIKMKLKEGGKYSGELRIYTLDTSFHSYLVAVIEEF